MAKNTPKKTSTSFDKMMLAIIVVVIAAVLALAVFATYGKIAANVESKAIEKETTAIQNGEKEATVRYLASASGMEVEAYLEQYGLVLGDELTKTSTVNEMTEMMTMENYYKFSDANSGTETDIEQLLTDWGAADLGITKDTVWSEVVTKVPFGKFIGGEEEFNSFVEQYKQVGYDISAVTADMPLKDAEAKLEEIMAAGPTISPAPTEEAPAEEATQTQASAAE